MLKWHRERMHLRGGIFEGPTVGIQKSTVLHDVAHLKVCQLDVMFRIQ